MKVVLSLLVVSSLFASVLSTSDGDAKYITLCDAKSPRFGCNPAFWPRGDRLKCANASTQVMSWASSPVYNSCYKLYAGDVAKPLSQYTPDQYIYIHLRVECFKMFYRGLLLYAVDKDEKRVGDWYLPEDEPALFHLPWEALPGHMCDKSLMHASAMLKPYHGIFRFKAPPAGTGSITFRGLIKYGDANTGNFYWPDPDLTLTEGPAVALVPSYQLSAVGQSCNDFCTQSYQGCDEVALQSLNSGAALEKSIAPLQPCKLPYLSGTGNDGASYDPTTEFCYYVDPANPVSCDTKTANASRFCSCRADLYMSSASSMRTGLLSLLALPLLFLSNSRSAIVLLALLGYAYGHNWINSNSRSSGASTFNPCKPPLTDIPHAQVGPNQAFQIEWMNGHGFPTYFAIQHSKDADKLKLNTVANLEDYINSAPNSSRTAPTGKYQKFHRKDTNNLANEVTNQTDFFAGFIYPNNSLWIYRPPSFKGRIGGIVNPTNNSVTYQMQYKPADLAQDVRVSYYNPKYPWLEAVYRFLIVTTAASRADTANFYIPGRGGLGRYIVQYYWRGYRDCIDVDYKSTTVASVYGTAPNVTRWSRIDHCLFEEPRNVWDVSEIVTDPQWCLDRCEARGADCYGVNVVPLKAPSKLFKFPNPANVTWFYPNIYGTDMYVPWEFNAFNASRDAFLANPSEDKYICYNLQPAEFTDTRDDHTLSNDPNDPIFYSTCYYKLQTNIFDDYLNKSAPATLDIPWRFVDQCTDCATQALNSYGDVAPKWKLADTCVNCDKAPVSVPHPTLPAVYQVEINTRCDGLNGAFAQAAHHSCGNETAGCVKPLLPLGRVLTRGPISVDECNIMAANDPDCSNIFFRKKTNPTQCYCYVKPSVKACCKTCSRRTDAAYDTYEVKPTPDPTCANGIISADGKACCSDTCGAGKCTNTTANIAPVGFCCSTCSTRSCANFGAPCLL